MIIYYALFFVFAFIFVFNLLTKKYINPYRLVLHIGRKGSGKTVCLTKLAHKYTKKGKRVYCTEKDIPNTIYIPVEFIGSYWFPDDGKTIILIDEIGLIWHCRSFADKSYNIKFKKVREWFKYQRHNKCIVECFTQSMDIDKNLRDLCDEIYIHTNFLRIWSKARRVGRRIVLSQPKKDDSGASDSITEEFYYISLLSADAVKFTFIPRWVNSYNSFSRLDLPDLPQEYLQKEAL